MLLESNSAKNLVLNILCLEQGTMMAWWDAGNKANAGEPLWSTEEVVHRSMPI